MTIIVIALYKNYKEMLIKVTYNAVLLSVFIQLVVIFINGGFNGARMIGSFNNPNQLGYYSLLTVSILIFASSKIKVKTNMFILGLSISVILALASLSKAAILSMVVLIIFFLLSKNQNKKFKRRIWIIFVLFLLASAFTYNTVNVIQESQLLNSVQNRINSIGHDNDDNLEGRGYTRLTDYPQYWIFGAGEGQYTRFGNFTLEFHSTLGNIQVSYGLIGSILFISLMFIALKKDKYRSWYILVSLLTYGLTHNGIRNSLLWILLGLMACVGSTIISNEKKVEKEL